MINRVSCRWRQRRRPVLDAQLSLGQLAAARAMHNPLRWFSFPLPPAAG
jgi:hypothetical protein